MADDVGMGEALLRGAGQGVTLGWGDEGAALLAAALAKIAGYDDSYGDAVKAFRRDNSQAAEEHPIGYFAGEAAGSSLPTVLSGGSMPAILRAGAVGGAGHGEEGNRGESAVTGALVAGLLSKLIGQGNEKLEATSERLTRQSYDEPFLRSIRDPDQRAVAEEALRALAARKSPRIKIEGLSDTDDLPFVRLGKTYKWKEGARRPKADEMAKFMSPSPLTFTRQRMEAFAKAPPGKRTMGDAARDLRAEALERNLKKLQQLSEESPYAGSKSSDAKEIVDDLLDE